MIERITSAANPNFFFLNYEAPSYRVVDFLTIPKHFFTPRKIEKRKPLPLTSKRAGWIGCNIVMKTLPQSGKIFCARNRAVTPKDEVLQQWQETVFLRTVPQQSRGWLLDVLACLEKLPDEFSLHDIYAFEEALKKLHPDNNFVKDKIRQQL